ncbi:MULTISPECIES: hypothetical protein [Bacillus]|uniref:hypothetical protein n=1 Tax=Bacillus TaxID=1386 RepID=UPI0004D5AFD0|nr:hypothetical protein [Bacillus safensis]KEP29131.1 hypothetical protein ER50_14665 [Bacillus safensis]MCY7479646.1 hypothetical protein [Bacillus safensis]MCY7513967.1 hypothetical protein [Bacillus safensis]MCY7544443.1 hypothetical protein [Bacillus safensis]MCY7551483.1 hypothetical protein [Bacillus safensis]
MNFKTVLTGFLSASALLGVISLSSVDFDVNSRNATSPESTDLTVRNATGNSFTTYDFRLITLSNQDFPLLTSNDEFNVTDSRAMTFDDSVSAIRFGTRDSRLST